METGRTSLNKKKKNQENGIRTKLTEQQTKQEKMENGNHYTRNIQSKGEKVAATTYVH